MISARRPPAFSFAAAALLTLATSVHARADSPPDLRPEPPLRLEPLEVLGTRLAGPDDFAVLDTVVLDRDYIDRSGAIDLAELLARLPQTYGGAGSGFATVPNGLPAYGNSQALFNFSGASPPLRQTGVSSLGLRGLGAGGTLVLVDGRRLPLATQEDTASATGAGFYDLSALPLGLIERVEVLPSGASAIYGSDAVGGVVNIILRRHYTGGEFTTGFRAAERGGGLERHATLTTGVNRDRVDLLVALTTSSRDALKASQRDFSRNQNLGPQGGFDHRLAVGSPAVVAAAAGNLNGVTTPEGEPARYGLVPAGQSGVGLAPADFTGANGFTAANLRRLDTSDFKDLIGAQEQIGLGVSLGYTFSPQVEGFARLSWSDRRSETANDPPATLGGGFGGAATVIPADHPHNPFGQDVLVSMAHVEAPPRIQSVDAVSGRATVGLRGQLAGDWEWETALTHARETLDSRTQELDNARFVAALADGSFNPFGDPATGPVNAALYPALMSETRIEGRSGILGGDATARGPIFSLPGGDARLALGVDTLRAERRRESTHPLFEQAAEIKSARTSSAVFSELFLPFVGGEHAPRGLHRLSARLAARREYVASFAETSPSAGLHWAPVAAIAFHASISAGFRAPSLTELEDLTRSAPANINDPRTGTTYPVTTLRGGNSAVTAETSRTRQVGVVITPPAARGLTLYARFHQTVFDNKLNALSPQVIVNAEDLFPDRVQRDAGGQITTVDATTLNYGRIETRSLDLGVTYERDLATLGRLALRFDATRQLSFESRLRPDGVAITIDDGADTNSPPRWAANGGVFWTKGSWDAGVSVTHRDGFESNSGGPFLDAATRSPSWTVVDFTVGHRFRHGIWGEYGRDARLQLVIGNVADRDPPYANTVYGYNPSLHSPLGRTYAVHFTLPF